MVKKVISKHQLSFTPLSSFCKLIISSWEHWRPWIMNVNSSSCWMHLRMHLFFSLSYTQSFSYSLPLLLTQEATESAKDVKKQEASFVFMTFISTFFLFCLSLFFKLKSLWYNLLIRIRTIAKCRYVWPLLKVMGNGRALYPQGAPSR